MLTSEVAVVNSHHGISVKCSRYRDTGTTDPSLVYSRVVTLSLPVPEVVGSILGSDLKLESR